MFFYLGNRVDKVEEKIRLNRNQLKSWKYGHDVKHDIIVISKDGTLGDVFYVNGLYIGMPETPKDEKKIANWDKTKNGQKWVHTSLPKGLNKKTQYNAEYEAYIKEEIHRRTHGYFLYIKGEVVYMTGTSYFFFQWNKLDEGYPNFRIIQNELMLYWEACKADNRCYGICYIKNRRFGWSTICNNEDIEAGTKHENKKIGIVSKTGDDAKEMFGLLLDVFKRLPPFFKPDWDEKTTSRLLLRSKDKGELEEGLDTYIRPYATALNSMDGGKKVFRSSLDECFGKGTKILMSDLSFRNIEDIEVDDYVTVEGGKKVRVAKTVNGVDDMYLIKQKYSKDYIVNSKHRLYLEQRCSVGSIKDDGVKIITPKEYLELGKYKMRTTYGVRSLGIKLDYKKTLIDPYLFGLWIGDGCKGISSIAVNVRDDKETVEYITKYCENNDYSLSIKDTNSEACKVYNILRPVRHQEINGRIKSNKFKDKLKKLGVLNNKNIPISYLNNSRSVRLKLLAGILDSDGHLMLKNNSYTYELSSSKKHLFDEILKLVRTLGFKVAERYKITNLDTDAWIMNISGDVSKIPCRVKRKRVPKSYKRQYASHINMVDVIPIGMGDYFGITLDSDNDDDRRLILEDFTISMNCGKFASDVPFDRYWRIVKTSHRQGTRIVGKSMVGSTVNSLKKGGAPFKKIYYESDPTKRNKNGQTTSGLYGLFISAELGLEGMYDTYGFSIVEDPKKPVMNDEGILKDIGSRTYLNNELESLKGEPEAFNEQLRQFPRSEKEAFRDDAGDSDFNLVKILEQIEYNEQEHNHNDYGSDMIERGYFRWKDGKRDTEVIWQPDPNNGKFWLRKDSHPPVEVRNKRVMKKVLGHISWTPVAKHLGSLGVDTYDRSRTADGKGSKGSIHIKTRYNTTHLPNLTYILEYIFRPRTIDMFFEDVLMCAVYYSMPIGVELAGEAFGRYLKERGYRNFISNNPYKKIKDLNPTELALGGYPAQNQKIADAQFYAVESFVEDHIGVAHDNSHRQIGELGDMVFNRTLEQWKNVDVSNRTKWDAYISSSLADIDSQVRIDKKVTRRIRTISPFTKYNNDGIRSKIN